MHQIVRIYSMSIISQFFVGTTTTYIEEKSYDSHKNIFKSIEKHQYIRKYFSNHLQHSQQTLGNYL